MALEIRDHASQTGEPKHVGATPVTVLPMRSCDAATLNVHGCRTTPTAAQPEQRIGGTSKWGRVTDKLRGLRPDQVSWTQLDDARYGAPLAEELAAALWFKCARDQAGTWVVGPLPLSVKPP